MQRASKLSSPTGMVISMPLTLGWVRGYNADRMVFEFTMLNDKIETVECSISSIAMDDLAGTHGSFPRNERDNFCTFAKRNRSLTNVCYREGDFLVTPHVLIAHENKARRFTLAGFRHESFLRSIVAMPSGSRGWSGPTRVVRRLTTRRVADI